MDLDGLAHTMGDEGEAYELQDLPAGKYHSTYSQIKNEFRHFIRFRKQLRALGSTSQQRKHPEQALIFALGAFVAGERSPASILALASIHVLQMMDASFAIIHPLLLINLNSTQRWTNITSYAPAKPANSASNVMLANSRASNNSDKSVEQLGMTLAKEGNPTKIIENVNPEQVLDVDAGVIATNSCDIVDNAGAVIDEGRIVISMMCARQGQSHPTSPLAQNLTARQICRIDE
ncbi:hypothetical protein C8J55DRAFT_490336 [Lentinula edodes]|uniref:Uncharacterized protein n=1 Tax=Lentinula lateritia TaxID=40482 RepID=A0A9W9A785_9AGAR|nr:hypothetical protein C8J55DRAFT_490336 [Lentinula edodes]